MLVLNHHLIAMQKLLTKYRMIVQAILAIAYITIIRIYQQPYKCRWLSNNRAHCSYNKKWGVSPCRITLLVQSIFRHQPVTTKKPAAAQSFGVIYSSSVPHLGWDGCHPGQRQTWLGFGPTRGSRGAKHPGIVVENP